MGPMGTLILRYLSRMSYPDCNRPVDVTIPAQWDPCLERLLEAVEAYGVCLLALEFDVAVNQVTLLTTI